MANRVTAASNCTGIYLEEYTQWTRLEHVFIEGGGISIHNQGQNNWLEDLILYDNNVPQAIQMDWMTYPICLVVAVQTSSNSGAVIDKLGGSGILFTQLLAADAGETAVISFSDTMITCVARASPNLT